jgi:cobalamin-dependent methionine synthase I
MIKSINQETLMPIGLAVLIIGTAATWVASVQGDIKSHSEQLVVLSKNHEAHIKLVMEINSRLSRIEWALESKGRK